MADSFFFYDLETSGFSPRTARIMQFAGQRTDLDLKPIGEPFNVLVKLTPDIVPDPDAIMVTGITPQQTLADGVSEAEFLERFYKQVVTPGTIFVGFNNIRFDDEFMRFANYRNFYDAYEWQWKDGTSRWDMLDVVRMARALKPEGIKWPFATDRKPTNRLGYLTKLNKLSHDSAHDALSDVLATIDVARLIKTKQPELFGYLLNNRQKNHVKTIVDSGKPFMYTSGRYPSQFLHTTAAVLLGRHAEQDYALVYDLRQDPTPFLKMSVEELIEAWKYTKDPEVVRLPVKTLKYNRSPAVVAGIVKDDETLSRLSLSRDAVTEHLRQVSQAGQNFVDELFEAVRLMDAAREKAQITLVDNQLNVDERLYDGFIPDADKRRFPTVRAAKPAELADLAASFQDKRLKSLVPLYQARNYPDSLDNAALHEWEEFRQQKLLGGGEDSRLTRYFKRLEELSVGKLSSQQQYLLDELQLYGQAIVPSDVSGDGAD